MVGEVMVLSVESSGRCEGEVASEGSRSASSVVVVAWESSTSEGGSLWGSVVRMESSMVGAP